MNKNAGLVPLLLVQDGPARPHTLRALGHALRQSKPDSQRTWSSTLARSGRERHVPPHPVAATLGRPSSGSPTHFPPPQSTLAGSPPPPWPLHRPAPASHPIQAVGGDVGSHVWVQQPRWRRHAPRQRRPVVAAGGEKMQPRQQAGGHGEGGHSALGRGGDAAGMVRRLVGHAGVPATPLACCPHQPGDGAPGRPRHASRRGGDGSLSCLRVAPLTSRYPQPQSGGPSPAK